MRLDFLSHRKTAAPGSQESKKKLLLGFGGVAPPSCDCAASIAQQTCAGPGCLAPINRDALMPGTQLKDVIARASSIGAAATICGRRWCVRLVLELVPLGSGRPGRVRLRQVPFARPSNRFWASACVKILCAQIDLLSVKSHLY